MLLEQIEDTGLEFSSRVQIVSPPPDHVMSQDIVEILWPWRMAERREAEVSAPAAPGDQVGFTSGSRRSGKTTSQREGRR
jgi:hypothetical protein